MNAAARVAGSDVVAGRAGFLREGCARGSEGARALGREGVGRVPHLGDCTGKEGCGE